MKCMILISLLAALALLPACSSKGSAGDDDDVGTGADSDADSDTDVDSDTDTDSDSDTDSDADTDSDTDTGSETDTYPPETVCLDFDEVDAPQAAIYTVALRDEYEDLGILFEGDGLNGGGVLDVSEGWGPVTGYSGSNALAFASCVVYSNYGQSCAPETLIFSEPVSFVGMRVGRKTTPVNNPEDTDFGPEVKAELNGCCSSMDQGCDGCTCEECVFDVSPWCSSTEWDNGCTHDCVDCGQYCGNNLLELTAFDSSDAVVDTSTLLVSTTLTEIHVGGAGIASVKVDVSALAWMVDDICFY